MRNLDFNKNLCVYTCVRVCMQVCRCACLLISHETREGILRGEEGAEELERVTEHTWRKTRRGWRDGAEVKTTCCPCGDLSSSFQHPHWAVHKHCHSNAVSGFRRHWHTCSAHTDKQKWELARKGKRTNGGERGEEQRGGESTA